MVFLLLSKFKTDAHSKTENRTFVIKGGYVFAPVRWFIYFFVSEIAQKLPNRFPKEGEGIDPGIFDHFLQHCEIASWISQGKKCMDVTYI